MLKNIYIYVSDDLRYDYTPDKIKSLGLSFKSISQAPFSHPSFSSLVTGVGPETHQVYNKHIDNIKGPTIFDLDKFKTSYWAESEYDSLYSIFNHPNRIDLENIDEPFILLERALETHAPFGKIHKDIKEYEKEVGNDYQKMKKYYKIGIEKSYEKFLSRIEILKKRDILEDTLVIFTSDHGELFEEYNRRGHMLPLSPELVFVPLIFINPLLPKKRVKNTMARTIDIVPTIFDIFGIGGNAFFEGASLLDENSEQRIYFSSTRDFDISKKISFINSKHQFYNAHSVWDFEENGLVEVEGSFKPLIGSILDTIYMKTSQFENWKSREYGSPNEEMERELEKYRNLNFEKRREKWKLNSYVF